MCPETTKLEITAHNIANASSTGFKRTKIFDGILTKEASGPLANGAGSIKTDFRSSVDFEQGELRHTGNPLDLALSGEGFFVLETPEGPRYTRDGNFSLGSEGNVVSPAGYSVQGEQGTIRIPEPEKNQVTSLMINEKGEIYLGDKRIDRIRTVNFKESEALEQDNNNMFSAPDEAEAEDVTAPVVLVRQGYLEDSNVDIIKEMIAMVDSRQTFETSQKIIRAQESTLDRAMEVGRVQ
jgi:flagellar basal-body rod protein FlgG